MNKVETGNLGETPEAEILLSPAFIKEIVGKAALEVPGVAGLSGSMYQNLVSWGAQSETKGIEVQSGDSESSKRIDLRVALESGQPIPTVAKNIQRSIKEVIEEMTGLEVIEVNVHIDEVREPPVSSEPEERAESASAEGK